jgi:hypothetical protein
VSKPDLSRWPNLKLKTHSALDWVEPVYDAAWLEDMAKRIDADTLLKEWTPATVGLLRALATTPAALKALNRSRPTPPRRVVGLNRAVHYIVRLELQKGAAKRALADVAAAWHAKVTTIQEDCTDYHVKKRSRFAPTDAHFIAEQIVGACSINRGLSRVAVLKAFDADMKHRAAQWLGAKSNREK